MAGLVAPPRASTPGFALRRLLVAAILTPALVLGSFDLHSSALPHGAFDGPSEVSPGARHPTWPQHLEASATLRVPSCFACLLQLKTSSEAVGLPALVPVPVVAEATLSFTAGAARRPLHSAPQPRGPPAA